MQITTTIDLACVVVYGPSDAFGMLALDHTMGASAQISRFEVENERGEVFGPFEVPGASGIYLFAASADGQRFTFKVLDSSSGNTGLVELEILLPEE